MRYVNKEELIKAFRDKVSIEWLNKAIAFYHEEKGSVGQISDGYHTFDELYHHRALLFATIVNNPLFKDITWKAKQHHDGTMFDDMFIVGVETPTGQATYHYDLNPYWDLFKVKELERAPIFDGHTPAQAIERILTLTQLYP